MLYSVHGEFWSSEVFFNISRCTTNIKRQRGVTLLEMMIVLAIVAIVMTVVAPSVNTILNKNSITAEINSISGAVQFGRFAAIDNNATVVICPSKNYESCTSTWNDPKIVFLDSNDNGARESDETLLVSTDPASSSNVITGPATSIKFFDSGAANMLASIVICPTSKDKTLARALNVNLQGRVRVSKDSDNNGVHEDINGTELGC